jgi:AmmeMemoRadiSam system protein B
MKKKNKIVLLLMLLPAIIIVAGSFKFFMNGEENNQKRSSVKKVDRKFLESFFGNKSDYEKAFKNSLRNEDVAGKNIIAGIISHHFLARNLIADFFSNLENNPAKNIILVGPDHFHALDKENKIAITSDMPWQTPYGMLENNSELSDKLISSGIVLDDTQFKTEHSIYTLIPFVKKVIPDSKIVPIIIKNNNDYQKFKDLGEKVKELSGNDSLVIVSSDFSHNSSINQAETNDEKSIQALKDLDLTSLNDMTCDCRACLAFLTGFLSDEKKDFFLLENKNSADFGSQDETVTSYVSGYYIMK